MKSNNLKMLLASLSLLLFFNVQAESLHQAVYANDIESVKSHLQKGADLNQLGHTVYGFGSALHLAVRENHREIVKLLLEQGAVVDIRDYYDYTPLHDAAWNGNLAMVKLLIDAGADIRATNYSGHTPLSCARAKNQLVVIQFIEGMLMTASN